MQLIERLASRLRKASVIEEPVARWTSAGRGVNFLGDY